MKSAIEVIQIMRDSLVIDANLLMVNRAERKALVEEFDRLCAELAKASKDQIAEMEGARAKAMEGAAQAPQVLGCGKVGHNRVTCKEVGR